MPRHCSVCGTMPDNILADHEWLIENKHATCTEDGFRRSECRLCGAQKEKIFPASGHDYLNYWTETKATCTTGGCEVVECVNCKDTYKIETEALGHDYQITKKVKENCTQGGYTTYTCTRCKDSYKSNIKDALGHAWVDANCEKPKTCSRCNIYEGVEKHNFSNGKCTKCGDLKHSEGLRYSIYSAGYVVVVGIGTCTDAEIIIPDSYQGFPITTIQSRAFEDCRQITSVIIPNSVTSIKWAAFQDCENLISVTIPNSVTSIGDSAFESCYKLTSITIPNSVTSIGNAAFNDCVSLTSITIPNSVTSIGYSAFSGCKSLSSVSLGTGITTISSNMFMTCYQLVSVIINGKIKSTNEDAFTYCKSLDQITFNGSIEEWQSIDLDSEWNVPYSSSAKTISKIICSDGTIHISD